MFNRLRRAVLFATVFWAVFSAPVRAQVFNSYPFILQNGTLADASQVMADFNQIANQVNANAANAPLNSNIGSISGLINGSAGTPSITWLGASTTGIFFDTVNGCAAVSAAATEVGCWNTSGIHNLPVQITPALQDAATVSYVNSQSGSLSVGGRLTLTPATPVLQSTTTAAPTIYFTPYTGNAMVFSNGSIIGTTTLSEVSQALSDTTLSPAAAVGNSNYDLFYWYFTSTTFTGVTSNGFPQITTVGGISGGTAALIVGAAVTGPCIPISTTIQSINSPTQITLTNNATCNGSGTFATNQSANKTFVISRGPAWTNSTTRGYTLSRLQGFLTNTSSISNGPGALAGIYVGTIRTDSSGATCSWVFGTGGAAGGQASFGIWNMYNRVEVSTNVFDTTASWTYNVATWREAHADSGFAVSWIAGLAEDGFTSSYQSRAANGGGSNGDIGVGFDTTTAPSSQAVAGNAAIPSSGTAVFGTITGLGVHFVAALEISETAVNMTFFGGSAGMLNWNMKM